MKCEDMILGDISENRVVVHHTSAQYPGINNLRRLKYVVWTSLDLKPISVSILFKNFNLFRKTLVAILKPKSKQYKFLLISLSVLQIEMFYICSHILSLFNVSELQCL